jgi:hypothetical protein
VQVPRHRPAHVAQAHEAHGHLLFRNAHRYRRRLPVAVFRLDCDRRPPG